MSDDNRKYFHFSQKEIKRQATAVLIPVKSVAALENEISKMIEPYSSALYILKVFIPFKKVMMSPST